ncbi:hypothetical protein EYF80_050117 [Liparis tanakae]|uniref:Uncharacterized protein n=1 Tax=Liparis tanakae TaxID=230148 RepID=A0A4Z2FFJ4_9TELE|nr:hypothetical protein EYF80_050117 [Liparis tanakae]
MAVGRTIDLDIKLNGESLTRYIHFIAEAGSLATSSRLRLRGSRQVTVEMKRSSLVQPPMIRNTSDRKCCARGLVSRLQQRQPHVSQQPGQRGAALLRPRPHPEHQGLEHTLLAPRVQVVPLQDGLQRRGRQLQEVRLPDHLGEVGGDVVSGAGPQRR